MNKNKLESSHQPRLCRNGCCGCWSDSFNEDAFEKEVAKDMERVRDPNAPVRTSQPERTENMSMDKAGGTSRS